MKAFTILTDKHYLDRGIALYESIDRLMECDYRFYYLCLDRYTFNIIAKINNKTLIPVYIEDEFCDNKGFELLVKNNQSVPMGFSKFHFALSAFFTNYIMEKESPESVMYIDADILFYHSPEIVSKYMKGKSIGLILHRHNKIGAKVGGFNTGIIYFRGDSIGRKALKWWRDVVIDPNNKWHETYGGFADQKYLELFPVLFGKENVKILDDDIGHGAPWNFPLYKYFSDRGKIRWNGRIQLLVFNHFARFSYDNNSYDVRRNKINWKNFSLEKYPLVKRYYDDYFEILKDVKKRHEL